MRKCLQITKELAKAVVIDCFCLYCGKLIFKVFSISILFPGENSPLKSHRSRIDRFIAIEAVLQPILQPLFKTTGVLEQKIFFITLGVVVCSIPTVRR
jgi:hypothetical protein